jgi:hypothetical protein
MSNLQGAWLGVGVLAMLTCLQCGGDAGEWDKITSGAAGEPSAEAGRSTDGGTGAAGSGESGGTMSEASAGAASLAGASGVGGTAGAGGAGEEPIVVTGDHYKYVVGSLAVPTSATQSKMLAFDLDGNGSLDNRYGDSMATLASQGFDSNPALAAQIANGTTITLLALQAPSLSSASGAGLLSLIGREPMPPACQAANDCGHHLNGEGSFAATRPAGTTAAVGTITDGVFFGKGGTLAVQVGLGGPLTLTLTHAQAELSELSEAGFASGRVGGAITADEIDGKLFPAVHGLLSAAVDRDCTGGAPPTCGCVNGTAGGTYIGLLDSNRDCSIGLDELKANTIIKTLFAPDLDLDRDGTKESLSCAFGLTGAKATFELP